jgi:hypothetical protein
MPVNLSVYIDRMNHRSMQEPTLILTAMAAGPQHGYGIITDVLRISGERVRLGAGTLYAALDRLRGLPRPALGVRLRALGSSRLTTSLGSIA